MLVSASRELKRKYSSTSAINYCNDAINDRNDAVQISTFRPFINATYRAVTCIAYSAEVWDRQFPAVLLPSLEVDLEAGVVAKASLLDHSSEPSHPGDSGGVVRNCKSNRPHLRSRGRTAELLE